MLLLGFILGLWLDQLAGRDTLLFGSWGSRQLLPGLAEREAVQDVSPQM